MPHPIQVRSREELIQHVQSHIKEHGPTCDLNHLDVSGLSDFRNVFDGTHFDGDVSRWDVSNATTLFGLFNRTPFNGDVSKWNVSKTKNFSFMFGHTPFNGNLSAWDLSSASTLEGMFYHGAFNGDIAQWNVSNVKKMDQLFFNCPFAGDISNWDVSNATSMGAMFQGTPFNGDISKWQVARVQSMHRMFYRSLFQGDISRWDVSGLQDATSMFYLASFNGDISNWDLRGARTSLMLDTVHFQGKLPNISVRCLMSVVNAGYTGDARSLINVDHATRVFGSKKRLDTHLAATIGAGLNHLHIERIVQLSNKPSWCSKADYEEAKAVASMCNAMGVDRAQWAAHAYRSYCARREVATCQDALADFAFE